MKNLLLTLTIFFSAGAMANQTVDLESHREWKMKDLRTKIQHCLTQSRQSLLHQLTDQFVGRDRAHVYQAPGTTVFFDFEEATVNEAEALSHYGRGLFQRSILGKLATTTEGMQIEIIEEPGLNTEETLHLKSLVQLPELNYREIISETDYDDLGRPIHGSKKVKDLFLQLDDHHQDLTPLINSTTGKPTKLSLNLGAYVDCLQGQLQ